MRSAGTIGIGLPRLGDPDMTLAKCREAAWELFGHLRGVDSTWSYVKKKPLRIGEEPRVTCSCTTRSGRTGTEYELDLEEQRSPSYERLNLKLSTKLEAKQSTAQTILAPDRGYSVSTNLDKAKESNLEFEKSGRIKCYPAIHTRTKEVKDTGKICALSQNSDLLRQSICNLLWSCNFVVKKEITGGIES